METDTWIRKVLPFYYLPVTSLAVLELAFEICSNVDKNCSNRFILFSHVVEVHTFPSGVDLVRKTLVNATNEGSQMY